MPLPPLHAIEALDRLERAGSALRAAEALSITPSALSHRLKALEAALGFAATRPDGRGLALTPRGRRFLEAARPALAALHAAAAPASEDEAGPLTVAAAPGFAAAWLCPRISDARAAIPGLRLTLSTGPRSDADVRVLFERPDRAPPDARPLIRPDFFPVCAPSLANAPGGMRRPGALADATLLHLYDEGDWRRWLAAAKAPDGIVERAARHGRSLAFGDANLLIAAALAGEGVALGDPITCDGALAAGALIRPFETTARSERGYFLELSADAPPAAARFAEWLAGTLR
ncbi:MAG: LysR substrate-binding domain-containing protein [Pseudomonadota bacterium]